MLSKAALVALAALASVGQVSALWPIPQEVSTGKDVLFIDKNIKVTYNGQPVNHHTLAARAGNGTQSRFSSKTVVKGGVQRALHAIFDQGLVPWMLHPPGSDFEPAPGGGQGSIRSLKITQTAKDNSTTFKPIAGTVDETYTLNLTSGGEASIEAASSTGVLRGLETFTQLFYKHSSGNAWYTNMAPVAISDSPNFPYRGILLDVARHWFPVSDIKRTIDGAAMAKMNIIHIHVTESQSWPLEIPAIPELTKKGSFAPGLTYSPDDIRGIQEYATARGVQAIFEIDMPGHFRVEQAFPDLSVAYNAKPYSKYCSSPPCGALRLNNTDVEDFLDKLFDDLLPRLSPYSSYFHTGGDEYKPTISLLDPALKTQDMKILKPLLQRFLDHAHKKIRAHGLIPMVWEEMIGEWGAVLPKDTIIQSWFNTVTDLAKAGHKVIDSTTDIYYLDCGRGGWIDTVDSAISSNSTFLDWCDPTKNWRLIYNHDPIENLTAQEAKNVLGGEAAVWAETIDPINLDSITWPRAAVAGEGWWSGRKDSDGNARSIYHARPRLNDMRERMLARGIRGSPITTLFCDQSPIEDCTG